MVPYIVPMLPTRPTPSTSHGFALMSLKLHPFMCSARAAIPIIPIPRPVCMKVSLRYSRSNGGMPPSSRVSRLKMKLIPSNVAPKMPLTLAYVVSKCLPSVRTWLLLTSSVQQTLSHVALRHRIVCGLLVSAPERLLEPRNIVRCRYRGLCGAEEVRLLLQWRVVEGADCEGLRCFR